MIQLQPTVAKLFNARGISPLKWAISETEQGRIASANIGVTFFCGGATTVTMSRFPDRQSIEHLVVLDYELFNDGLLSGDQVVAMLLHEIGHIVNIPDPANYKSLLEYRWHQELFADYYAFYCGYGNAFSQALKCLRDRKAFGFVSPEVDSRIESSASPHVTYLNLK